MGQTGHWVGCPDVVPVPMCHLQATHLTVRVQGNPQSRYSPGIISLFWWRSEQYRSPYRHIACCSGSIADNVFTSHNHLSFCRTCRNVIDSQKGIACEDINIQFPHNQSIKPEVAVAAMKGTTDFTDHIKGCMNISLACKLRCRFNGEINAGSETLGHQIGGSACIQGDSHRILIIETAQVWWLYNSDAPCRWGIKAGTFLIFCKLRFRVLKIVIIVTRNKTSMSHETPVCLRQKGNLLKKWGATPVRLAVLHIMQDLTVLFGCDERGLMGKGIGAHWTRFSSMDLSSSRRDDIDKDISGFKEATVLLRNSGPYLCFTNWGNPGCLVFGHSTTIVFSKMGTNPHRCQ